VSGIESMYSVSNFKVHLVEFRVKFRVTRLALTHVASIRDPLRVQ